MKNRCIQRVVGGVVIAVGCVAPVSALTLSEVIEHVLTTHPEIQADQQQLMSREREIRGARADYLPSVDAELGVGREWTESPATGGNAVTLTRREAALRVRQMLYDGSATSREVDRQQARYNSARFALAAREQNVSLRAVEAYIQVMRESELLELLQRSLDEHQNIYDQMTLRSRAGVGSRADLDQIAARLSLATSNFLAGQNNLQDAVSQFYTVVGYLPAVSTLEKPQDLSLPSDMEQALTTAFDEHPQLKSAEADILAATAQYQASKSPYRPRLTLEGDRTWNDNIDGVRGGNEDWVLALRLRYNLYRGGQDAARHKQTAFLLEEARAVKQHTHRQVEEAMRLSWHAYAILAKQLPHLTTYVTSVAATKEAYRKQFTLGKRSLLDLLNTESELLEADSALLEARYDYLFAQYRVAHAQGGLLAALGVGE